MLPGDGGDVWPRLTSIFGISQQPQSLMSWLPSLAADCRRPAAACRRLPPPAAACRGRVCMCCVLAAHMASRAAAHGGRGDTHGKRLVGLAKHKSLASPSGTLGCTRNYATTAICLFFYYPLHIYPFSDAYLFIYSVCAELPYPPPLFDIMYFDQIMK